MITLLYKIFLKSLFIHFKNSFLFFPFSGGGNLFSLGNLPGQWHSWPTFFQSSTTEEFITCVMCTRVLHGFRPCLKTSRPIHYTSIRAVNTTQIPKLYKSKQWATWKGLLEPGADVAIFVCISDVELKHVCRFSNIDQRTVKPLESRLFALIFFYNGMVLLTRSGRNGKLLNV